MADFGLEISIDGKPVGSDGFASAMMTAMRKNVLGQMAARLSGLVCSEHGGTPTVEWSDRDHLTINACCQDMLERAQAASGATQESGETDMSNVTLVAAEEHSIAPLAFLSHSGLDKERFITPLESALRARGIRTWYDDRDLLAGQNLVDRIFDQGLGISDVVVVILSKNTEHSAWVHKELTTAVVSQISGQLRAIIPVLLDDVAPPVSLRDTKHIRASADQVESVANQIRDAIFGVGPAPVAPQPAYAGIPVHRLPSLEAEDERILAIAADLYLRPGYCHPYVSVHQIVQAAAAMDMSQEVVIESLGALEQAHYFEELKFYIGSGNVPHLAKFSDWGFTRFLIAYRPREYRRAKKAIVAALVNGASDLDTMAAELDVHQAIAQLVLRDIESAGYAKVLWHLGGAAIRINPTLPRLLRQLEADSKDP
jgi:hypothetical protein